jgi:2'-5' RNA ligase
MSKFKDLAKNLLVERDASTLPEKCSTQVNLPENVADPIRRLGMLVKEEHLHEYGRESEPHITVLYGINPTPSALNETEGALRGCGTGPVTAKLGDLSTFSNEKFDVLKFEIISEDLSVLNKELSGKLDFENDYPDYNPHLTIAYVKPGLGKYYIDKMNQSIGNRLTGKPIKFDTVLYSDQKHKKTPIKLGYPQSKPVQHANTEADLNEDLGVGGGNVPSGNAYMSGQMGVYNSPNTRQNPGAFGNNKRYNMMNNNTVIASGYYDTVYDSDIYKMMTILKSLNFEVEWPANDYEDEMHLKDPVRADQTHTQPSNPNPGLPGLEDEESQGQDDALPTQSGVNLSNQTVMRYLKAEFGDKLEQMHKTNDGKITYDSIMLGLKEVMSDLQFPDKDYAFIRVLKQVIEDPKYYDELGKYDIKEEEEVLYEKNVYGTKFKPQAITAIIREMQ